MTALTSEQRQALLESLEAIEAGLLEGAAQRKQDAEAVQLDQARVGRLSRMDAMQQQALAQASERRAAEQLQRVHSALMRIRSPAYGLCVDCKEPIPFGRLNADPCVLLCIECQGFRDEDAADEERRRRSQGRR